MALNAECRKSAVVNKPFKQCRYAECRYGECRGALLRRQFKKFFDSETNFTFFKIFSSALQ